MSDLFHTFLLDPTKYETGIGAGFIVFPHSDENPQGWGEPYTTPNGGSIEPGTMGGPNANRKVGIKSGKWKRVRSKYQQAAGNIDWCGPWRSEQHLQRFIISCNGPNSRHWNPEGTFKYDLNANHEIYMDGGVVSVAPYPVLGAAFGKTVFPNNDGTTSTIKVLVAICKRGDREAIYMRKLFGAIKKESLTQAVREEMQKMYDPDECPTGWSECGVSSPPEGAYAPETPWFFKEDGTEARAMRRVSRKFTDDLGTEKTEDLFVQVSCTLNFYGLTGAFHFTDQDPTTHSSGMACLGQVVVSERMFRQRKHQHVDDFLISGDYHHWLEDRIATSRTLAGAVQVAVDWDAERGEWVRGWLEYECSRAGYQDWNIGNDNDFPKTPPATYTYNNTGVVRRPADGQSTQPGKDHVENTWISCRELVYLVIGTRMDAPDVKIFVGYGRTSTQSAYFGHIDPDDTFFYHWDSFDVFLHYCDLRSRMVTGYMYWDSIDIEKDDYDHMKHRTDKREILGKTIVDPSDSTVARMLYTSDKTDMGSFDYNFGFTVGAKNTWPDSDIGTENAPQELTMKSYQAAPTTANNAGEHWVPTLDQFYTKLSQSSPMTRYERQRTHKYFLDAGKCYREGTFLCNEKKNHLISYVYKDENAGVNVIDNYLDPEGDLASIVGGTMYYPGGIV